MRDALFSSTLDKPIDDEGAEREVVRKTKAEPARSLMRERREAERTSMKGEDGAKRSAEEGLGMGIDDFAFKPETAGEADDRGGKTLSAFSHESLSFGREVRRSGFERRAQTAYCALIGLARNL